MISTKRDTNLDYEIFSIKNDKWEFKMFSLYNSDVYWTCDVDDSYDTDTYEFEIGIGDSYIYRLIADLYDSVSNYQPFKHLNYDFECKDLVFNNNCNNTKSLFKDGVIEWHSDDYAYNIASVLYIKKSGNNYVITFKKSKVSLDQMYPFSDFTVTFALNHTRYNPYNITFMDMFNKVRDYNFYNNQVQIKNYTLSRKVQIKK